MRSGPQALSTESEWSIFKTACEMSWLESIKSGPITVEDLTSGNKTKSSTVTSWCIPYLKTRRLCVLTLSKNITGIIVQWKLIV